jgi:SAM-dependent methyltransferase
MPDREQLARGFDSVAELYDEARPGYPQALFGDLCSLSGIPDGGRVLEIGCGTGKATLPLAQRGYRILCLEPGDNLAAVAWRNLSAFPEVEIAVCSFEDWELEPAAFDLAVAASSFKWLDPATRYAKIGAALGPGGCAAVFWNAHVYVEGEDRFFDDVQAIYRRYLPETVGRPPLASALPMTVDPGFIETGLFDDVTVRHYPWTDVYDTDRYLKVLRTFSEHIALPDGERAALLGEIGALIDREFGGRVAKHLVTVLQMARRLAGR